MSKGKVLTKDIALDFVARGGRQWELNDFTLINEDAALVLSEFSDSLYLNGLKTISEKAGVGRGFLRGRGFKTFHQNSQKLPHRF